MMKYASVQKAKAVEMPSVSKDSGKSDLMDKLRDIVGLGDALGPIGMTIGGDVKQPVRSRLFAHLA